MVDSSTAQIIVVGAYDPSWITGGNDFSSPRFESPAFEEISPKMRTTSEKLVENSAKRLQEMDFDVMTEVI